MTRLLLTLWLCLFPAWAYAASINGGGSGGTGGAGDVGSISATTATNPSAEAALKELTLTAAALNSSAKKLIYHASGRYTTAAAQTPTLRFRVYLCTVSGCGSGTVLTLADFTTAATTASTTNSWKVEGSIGTVSTGATGTVESKFWQQVQLGAAADLTPETRLDQNNAASAAIDLTGVLYVRTTVLMSSANAGNSVTQRTGWVDGGAGTSGGGGASAGLSGAVQTSNGIGGFLDSGLTASAGTITGTLSGTATALAANGANCSAGSAPLGVDASGAAETCTDYMEEPGSNGLVARTAANTAAARTVTGTANQVDVTNGSGAAGNPTLALSSTLVIPGPGITFTETAGDLACGAGDYWVKANSTTTNFRKCQNGTVTDLDTGGGGSITGTVGTTDNAVPRADGTGGTTVQASGCTISDTNLMTCPGGFASTTGTGVLVLSEGTAPGAGTNASEHNVYFDSADSKLKSHENGGSVQTYTRTADNLSVFASTTSTQLRTLLSDPTGSGGGAVFATSPTISGPTLSGAVTFSGTAPTLADGVTWTFNPNGTSAGLNIGSQAGAVGTPNNGDMWYDTTGNKYKCRENGVTVDCISTGAGSGDITDVTAGAGVAVTSPGGPAPTVAWDPSTFAGNVTMWDAANASRTWTANLSGATDPVWTYSNGVANLSTGTLQAGGSDVATAASATAFTNKSLDCNGTGNTCKIQKTVPIHVAGCVDATAGHVWNAPAAASAATPVCVNGTNVRTAALEFPDADNRSFQFEHTIDAGWDGGDMTIRGKWFSDTASTNNIVMQFQFVCVADAETGDPSWDADILAITDAGKGTTLQRNDFSGTIAASTHLSTCAAGELLQVKPFRDAGHASDNFSGTMRLLPMELVYWVNQ